MGRESPMGHATSVLMHGGLIFGLGRSIIGCFDFTTQTTNKSETDPQEVEIGQLGSFQYQSHLRGLHWMYYGHYYSHKKHLKKNSQEGHFWRC